MNRKKVLLGVFSLSLLVLGSPLWAQGNPIVAESNGIKVSIVLSGANAEITVSAPYSGWVAVGFDPTRKMADANLLIGYVKDGVAYGRDDFGASQVSHKADTDLGGIDNLISVSGSDANGVTTITFVVPVNSGDPKDVALTKGRHQVIMAASRADNFTGIHARIGKASIVIP